MTAAGVAAEAAERPFDDATRRLVRALDRLESNLTSLAVARERQERQEQQMARFARENAELKQECEELYETVARLQGQYAELQKVAASVYGTLGDSVRTLTEIMEEQ